MIVEHFVSFRIIHYHSLFQLTVLQLFAFEDAHCFEVRRKDLFFFIIIIIISFYFQCSNMCGFGVFSYFSFHLHVYCFPFNLFVKHITIEVFYLNFLRCAILFFSCIQNTSLNLFKSYLSERSQFVSIAGTSSPLPHNQHGCAPKDRSWDHSCL